MVNNAKKFAEEDKRVKETVTLRNELESHAYQLKNQVLCRCVLQQQTLLERVAEVLKHLQLQQDKCYCGQCSK
ncbi:unnamed protein product [Meloidogyne enterolobii]